MMRIVGTPPRLAQEQQRGHVPQEQTNAAPPTKIPSLFDIKVAPPKNFKLGRRGGSPGRSGNGRFVYLQPDLLLVGLFVSECLIVGYWLVHLQS